MFNMNDKVKIVNSGSMYHYRIGTVVGIDNKHSSITYDIQFEDESDGPVCFWPHELELVVVKVKAIDLNVNHLWHWVKVTDYSGKEINGVLHRIELDGDSRTRVVLRVMVQERESGGVYWSTFGDEFYVNQQADVEIGDLLPKTKDMVSTDA
jgi:hypothetical protein